MLRLPKHRPGTDLARKGRAVCGARAAVARRECEVFALLLLSSCQPLPRRSGRTVFQEMLEAPPDGALLTTANHGDQRAKDTGASTDLDIPVPAESRPG